MSLSRVKVWIAGEVLTALDLNAEFNNIINNAATLISPLTAALDLNGQELILDVDGDTSLTADTDDQIDVKVGGSDVGVWTAAQLQLTGSLTVSSGSLVFGGSTVNTITGNTVDGSDTAALYLNSGGGTADVARGAYIALFGNEHASAAGDVHIRSGNVSGGDIFLQPAGVTAVTVAQDLSTTLAGNLTVSGTIGASAQIFTTGANTAHGASRILQEQESASVSVISAYGADTSTNGSLKIVSRRSNGSNAIVYQFSESFLSVGGATITTASTTALSLATGGGTQVQITNTASADRHLTITGGVSGSGTYPTLSPSGGGILQVSSSTGDTRLLVYDSNSGGSSAARLDIQATGTGGKQWFIQTGNTASGLTGAFRFYEQSLGETARFTTGGYFKASNSGTYAGVSAAYHEIYKDTDTATLALAITAAQATGNNAYGVAIGLVAAPNDATRYFLRCGDGSASGIGGGTERATIRSNGGFANYQANDVNLSDASVKEEIIPLESMWNKFKSVEFVKFKYKDQTHEDFNYGYTADNVEKSFPELVDDWGDGKLKAVYDSDLKNIGLKVVQECMERIEQLERGRR